MGACRALALALLVLGAGYASPPVQAQQKVVIYSSNDDTLHKLVFAAFTKETGIAVEPVSAGSGVVVKRIQTEKDRPGGDIIWGVSRSLLETNKQFFSPYRVEESRRHARRIPGAGQPLDRQQPASDGDPAEHQGAPRGPGPQDLEPTCSIPSGRARSPSPTQPTPGSAYSTVTMLVDHFGGGDAGWAKVKQLHRQHPRAQPLLAGVPGRRQRRVSARHLARIRRLRVGRRRRAGEDHLSRRRHARADGRRGHRSRAARTRKPPRPSSTTSTARMCAR